MTYKITKSCLARLNVGGWKAIVWRRGLSSSYVAVDDQKIHIVQEGTGSHPLLLLPGALGSATSDFYPQLVGLSKVS